MNKRVNIKSETVCNERHSYTICTAIAIEICKTSLSIAKSLAKRHPSNIALQRDLSISYNRIGDLQFSSGDVREATSNYEASFEVTRLLASSHPDNDELQRDLIGIGQRVGELLRILGHSIEAQRSYETILEIAKNRVAEDPNNTLSQCDLVGVHQRLGDIQRINGYDMVACESYGFALSIAECLVDLDPSNAEWQFHGHLRTVFEGAGLVQSAHECHQLKIRAHGSAE